MQLYCPDGLVGVCVADIDGVLVGDAVGVIVAVRVMVGKIMEIGVSVAVAMARVGGMGVGGMGVSGVPPIGETNGKLAGDGALD